MSGIDRSEARERVRDTVNGILEAWHTSQNTQPTGAADDAAHDPREC